MNIPVLPPDVNQSFEEFGMIKGGGPNGEAKPSIDGSVARSTEGGSRDAIRFGLTTIKNFGEGIATSIVKERKANGQFKSLSEFLTRIKDKNLNRKSLESLIKVGAFESITTEDRATLLHNIDRLLTFNKEQRSSESDQDSLFGGMMGTIEASEVSMEKAPPSNPADRLMWEKELLGLYISGHPLDSFREKLEGKENNIRKIKEIGKEKMPVVFGAIIEEIREVMTKKGEKMVFLKLSDLSDSIEAVAFPKVLEEFQDIIIPESCIAVKGTFSTRNNEKSILVDKVKLL
jgi:DNA polymerase-3 subunit alpha